MFSIQSSSAGIFNDLVDLSPLPSQVVDSHGLPMDVSQDRWQFNVAGENLYFDFADKKILNEWLLYALKRHLLASIQRISPRECCNIIKLNVLWMGKAASWGALISATDFESHEILLDRVMGETLALLRKRASDYQFHRIRAWYSWCTDFIPQCGFDSEDAYKWEVARISGNEKGLAVRSSDPDAGPLNDAELILLRRVLQRDNSTDPQHVFERTALWLSLVYGRNPANFCQLRQGDFRAATTEDSDICVLNIPRIKKRARPRTKFKEEYVAPPLAIIIRDQIKAVNTLLELDAAAAQGFALFPRSAPRSHQLGTAMEEWAWHRSSAEFTQLLRSAVKRYGLISPRTNSPLHLTARRLRYTFATNRVREGISAQDLAEALDHSDLQHVRVYFDARSSVVERLDAAGAKEVAPKLQLFEGKLVKDGAGGTSSRLPQKRIRIIPELITKDHHIRDLGECGKDELCNLFPPYSCYPCSRFMPFEDSLDAHEAVFDFLIERRERLRTDPLEQSRIAVQLDEVIYACAEVILAIKGAGAVHAT